MRSGTLLAVVLQLACLDAPPEVTNDKPSDGGTEPVCAEFGAWAEPSLAPGLASVFGSGPTVDADAQLLV